MIPFTLITAHPLLTLVVALLLFLGAMYVTSRNQ